MSLDLVFERIDIFHCKFINIWHHICFLWWDCDRSMLMTWGRVHNVDTRRRLRMWRDVTWSRSHQMKQMGPPALMTSMTFKWTSINDAKRRKRRHFKRQPNYCLIYLCVSETKRERVAHWLSVFNIVIFYFDNFDMIL
jgi:hypothetical protein